MACAFLLSGITSYGQVAGSAEEFKAQMEVILKDFANNFSNISGAENIHESDEEYGYRVYNSLVQLGNAEELYMENDFFNKTYSFYAGFPGSPDPEITLKAFRTLLDQIEAIKFSYYPLIRGEDKVDGNKHQVIFMPDADNSQLDPAFKEQIIVVYLDRAIKTNNEGKIVWIPYIRFL